MKRASPEIRAAAGRVTIKLADEGRLIEAGWQALRAMAIKPNATEVQLKEMRFAFFAGAQHLFGSLSTIVGKRDTPTAADLHRLEQITKELEGFIRNFEQIIEQHGWRKDGGA